VKYFDWNREKNELLKIEREISFEAVLVAIEEGKLLDIVEHTGRKKYHNQRIFVVDIDHYAYLVPFVEDEEKVFLKTVIPSRKATEKYLVKGVKKI